MISKNLNYQLLRLILLLVYILPLSLSLSCDKVATLPNDFDILMPDRDKLSLVHISNNFFLDESNSNKEISISIKLKSKSVMKIQVTPRHAQLTLKVKTPTQEKVYPTGPALPIDFTLLDPNQLFVGEVILTFGEFIHSQDTLNQELGESALLDTICDVPYMYLDIYYEKYEHFQNRTSTVSKSILKLKDFNQEYWNIFEELKAVEAKSKNKNLLVSKVKRALSPFKLTMHNTMGFYEKFNISVINEYKLTVPDEQIYENEEHDDNYHLVTKYFIKMQIYSDFLFGGGLHLLIIHSNGLNSLENLRCLNDGKCVISERHSKNAMILETILSPGSYTLLLLNLNMNANEYKLHLNLNQIPISAGIKLKYIKKTENRFNCEGKRIPNHLNPYLNANPNYFEYKGKIAFNMYSLKDSTYISIPKENDYFMRLNTYFMDGNNINIKVFELTLVNELKIPGGHLQFGMNVEAKLNETAEVFYSQSGNWAGQSSLYLKLKKGVSYRILFDYSESFFTQYVRKTCELYYLKMAISSEPTVKLNSPMSIMEKMKCPTAIDQLDTFIHNFEEQHSNDQFYKYQEYEQISNTIYSYNDVSEPKDFKIIYSKSFNIKTPISFYIQVMSDFVTSSVIPVLIPVPINTPNINVETYLETQLKKLILHKGTINMKMTPGRYQLVLLHGLNQVTSNNKKYGNFIDVISLPMCSVFKIKINAIKLSNNKLLNWECHYKKFHHIPEAIELSDSNDKYFYFNHHILVPIERDVIQIKTTNSKFILRLRAQFDEGNSSESMSIVLKRADKALSQAKPEIFEEGKESNIVYLNFLLANNAMYELHFANKFKVFSEFYDKCRMFTLDLMLAKEKLNEEKCDKNIPTISQILYEKVIDEDSFTPYSNETLYRMMFKSKNFDLNTLNNNLEMDQNHTMFSFRFNENEEMSFEYPFEIHSNLARATMIVETPYALPIEISARMYVVSISNGKSTNNLIATEDIEDENIYTLRGILLNFGKYVIKFKVNQQMYNNVVKEALKNFCVQFTATILIENKPHDSLTKGATEKAENCPYIEFPKSLNLPGWIYSDTSNSLNSRFRFKIKNDIMTKSFTITKKSLFKFHLFDDDRIKIHNTIVLSEERNNKVKLLVEKMTKEDNYISTVLDKGNYIIDFNFELNNNKGFYLNTEKDAYDHLCYFFDIYITIQPLDEIGFNDYDQCVTELTKLSEIKPESYEQFIYINFKDTANSKGSNPIKTVVVEPNNKGAGQVSVELIFNSYLSPIFAFYVYKIDPLTHTTRYLVTNEMIYSDNFIWLTFKIDKDTKYEIEFISGSFMNYSQCVKGYISYSNELKQNDNAISTKSKCEIDARLPLNLYQNVGNSLAPYGGGQSLSNGEMYFYGKFLLPKSSISIRTEFLINEPSIVVIKLNPLYNPNQNNIFLEIYKDNRLTSRYSHNELNGLIMGELANDSFLKKNNNEASLHYLDITFDRTLTKCETFELLFSIVPKSVYTNIYFNCNNAEEKQYKEIPNQLSISTTQAYQFSSHLKQGFVMNSNNNFEKIIDIELDNPTVFEATVKYISSENMIDISISNDERNYYSLGKESIESGHINGIWIHKTIAANLKKGKYKLKILYHSIFTSYFKKVFPNEFDSFCFGFKLDISASILNLNNMIISSEDESNNEAEIKKLTDKDINKNAIVKVSPSGAVNLRLGNKLELKVSFALPTFVGKVDINKYSDLISLIDTSIPPSSYVTGITPDYISSVKNDELTFIFELNIKKYALNKCYKLSYNSKFQVYFDDITIGKTDHLYCLMKCDCNPISNFSCSLNGKCKCKSPYTGLRCEECIEGFVTTNSGSCINNKLSNMKCDDKTTCNENGYCYFPNSAFNPFDINVKNICKCNEGFDTKSGYPISSFCNTCKNRKKYYPFCYDKEGDSRDKLRFNWSTHCSDFPKAPTIPNQLFMSEFEQSVLSDLSSVQKPDGTINFSGIFKTSGDDDYTEIMITEESIIRVLFVTQEYNRAQLLLLNDKNSEEILVSTDGEERTESFIAKLTPRSSPYVLRIVHSRLKTYCNRYQIKISIHPVRNAFGDLVCPNGLNQGTMLNFLPKTSFTLNGNDQFNNDEKWYNIMDSLILSKDNFNNKTKEVIQYNYSQSGVLTKGVIDEVFAYNIALNVMNPVTFSAIVHYKFITSDIILELRHFNGTIIQVGNWIIPEVSQDVDDFYSGVENILDPGNYYLTITQNVAANHIMQMLYSTEAQLNKPHVDRCFKFMLNIQTNLINKPDKDLPTDKFESMYNRIISVEPSNLLNTKYNLKLSIYVNFKDSINSKAKIVPGSLPNQVGFNGAFFLTNQATNVRVFPTHAYLQGSNTKSFLLIYDQFSLEKNSCYLLQYDLTRLESLRDKTQKIASDAPTTHRFCTKDCECNENSEYECDGTKCLCKEPYKGNQCNECIDNFYFVDKKCISQTLCDELNCNGKGKCMTLGQPETTCACQTYFQGKDCSKCQDADTQFPDCAAKYIKSRFQDNDQIGSVIDVGLDRIHQSENECKNSFLPYDLDNLGFLHLDGNMHISGIYSIKNIEGKKYTTSFTLKEPSHIKLYLEHSKMTYSVTMFLVDQDRKLLLTSVSTVGPSGVNTASFLDFIGNKGKYSIVYHVKDFGTVTNTGDTHYADFVDENELLDECLTVFIEMQAMTLEKEKNVIKSFKETNPSCSNNVDTIPQLIPENMTMYNYQAKFYNQLSEGITTSQVHIRNTASDSNTIYFHHEYMYIPDYLNREVNFELSVNSKFLNAEVGILLEVVDVPEKLKKNIKDMTSKKLTEELSLKLSEPHCPIHCFSGVKKYNSVVISRVLPSDTLFRVWFYDISPKPIILPLSPTDYVPNNCIAYEASLQIMNMESSKDKLTRQTSASLCLSNELPTDLNNKDYLGDSTYIKKFGFHILDTFRIDTATQKGSTHLTTFSIDRFNLFRIIVFPGRVDTDLELYYIKNGVDIIIAKSTSKNFEDSIAIEIPPGKYKLVFRFFSPPSGFNKCESMKMEFGIRTFSNINASITKMKSRYPQDLKHPKINILEHFQNSNEIFNKNSNTNIYTFPVEKTFSINVDDIKKYIASISIADITFVIEEKDNQKIELNAYASSNFIFEDCSLYLTYTPPKGTSRITSALHKKNLNTLISSKLKSGTYLLSLRYYRRLHYVPLNNTSFTDENLERHSFGEVQFDAQLINLSNDKVSILTSKGYIVVQPQNTKTVSHYHKCRQFGLPVPQSFSSLRYLSFSPEMHIMDNFILPPMAQGENVISFQVEQIPSAMIRIYVESHDADIDIELREEKESGQYIILNKSAETVHFETIMQIIHEKKNYQIVLKYKGYADATLLNKMICKTFKMEIAIEKNHNYACPISSKYSMLNDLKPIPEVLPVKYAHAGSLYTYFSKNIFKGEDNQSGYVYMLRGEKDTNIEFATFTAIQPIDLRFEVVNDFLQAPVTLMLTSNSQVVLEENQSITKFSQESFTKLGPKSFIISYGQIFESRTTLLVKNLPKGKYSIYIHLPGLKTKFTNQRVCSIYDISIQAKKSRNHFRAKEIINTSSIKEDNLDLPVRIPTTLNSPRFMSGYGPYTYINYLNTYFLRVNNTESPKEYGKPTLINTITFNLKSESLVEFIITHNLLFKKFMVAIENQTPFKEAAISVLKPGDYKAVIKLIDFNQQDLQSNNVKNLINDSLFSLFNLYVGISPVNRVQDIYNYNTILSSWRQCTTTKFPNQLEYNQQKGEYRYMNAFATFRKEDIMADGVMSSFSLELTNSSRNRFIAELGTDYVLNMLAIDVAHKDKKYQMKFENNRGILDLILPRGRYTVNLVLKNSILIPTYTCIIFSVNIRAFEIDNLPTGLSLSHQLAVNEKDKTELLKPKCKGGILPLEIYPGSTIKTERISEDGTYILHIPNAIYFTNRQKSLYQKNINEIDINVNVDSLLRVTTYVENPQIFNIVPKIKFQNQNSSISDYYKNQRGGMVSKSLREKNSYWFLPKNSHNSSEFYILELGLENDESSAAAQSIQSCPKYNFDILIYNITKLGNRFNCTVKNGKIYQMRKPKMVIEPISYTPYIENITSSYFTEKEYGSYKINTDYYSGLAYQINLTLLPGDNRDYYVEARLGYPHSSSLFDITLLKGDALISYSTLLFSKNSTFTYQRLLQVTLKEGNYTIIISEYQWHNMTQVIKAKSTMTNHDKLYLCLPFSYSLQVTPMSESNSPPKIASIYPPGPVIIKVKDEDLALTVRLSTAPFTKKQEPITMGYNYVNVINAFYLSKRSKDPNAKQKKIHPTNAQGNVNSKEWMLFFSSKFFEGGVEYDFSFDTRWLFDSHGIIFTPAFGSLIVKSESSSESVAETSNGNINTMKSALEEVNLSEEIPVQITATKETDQKCNNHGSYIYDFILQKYICTCFDGFSGKYCDYCEGKIIENKCVYEDDFSEEIPTLEVPLADVQEYAILSQNSDKSNGKGIECGNCFNGICDYSNGKCICDLGYSGRYCDVKKIADKNTINSTPYTQSHSNIWGKIKGLIIWIGKLSIFMAIAIVLFYIYKSCHFSKKSGYNTLDQIEKEISNDKNTINQTSKEKTDLDPDSEDANLVDYEISTSLKKK